MTKVLYSRNRKFLRKFPSPGDHVPNFPSAGTWHEWTGNYDVESGDDGILTDSGPRRSQSVWYGSNYIHGTLSQCPIANRKGGNILPFLSYYLIRNTV